MKNIPTPKRVIEIKRKRRARGARLLILFFILIIALIVALGYFSFDKRVTLNNIVIKGASVIDEVEIADKVQEELEGRYFNLYSRANSFIYPNKEIYNNLITEFPRIKTLKIYKENINTLYLEITEREGSYLYCGAILKDESKDTEESCYFVNNDGYVFDKAPYFSGNVYFKYYVSLPDSASDPLGQNILSVDKFHSLIRFSDELEELGFKPVALVIDENGINYFYLDHNADKASPRIIFKDDNDLEEILNNLKTAMDQGQFADEIKSKYNSLLYIDLRFKNKVLYKFEQ